MMSRQKSCSARIRAERQPAPTTKTRGRKAKSPSSEQSERIVKKLWSYCQVLRDDGLSYQDYLGQLYVSAVPKDGRRAQSITNEEQPIPRGYRWEDLANPKMEGARLELHHRDTLKELALQGGMLG